MSKIDKPIAPNPRDSQYDKKPLQTGLNGLDFMSKRLNNHGGFAQQKRMINDKNWSLQSAIKFSYQGAKIRKVNETNIIPALINPDKTKANYDDKIVSTGYEFGLHPGDVFEWLETKTLWIVTLQELTELAYFRAEIRKCNHTIKWIDPDTKETHMTYAAIRGPVETQINYFQKNNDSIDKPNNSLSIYMPKNEETLKYFKRYSKFYLGELEDGDDNICWRVEARDSISMPGVLELLAEEYYSNEYVDDVPNDLAGGLIVTPVESDNNRGYIEGPSTMKVRIPSEFIYRGKIMGEWSWSDNAPIKVEIDGRHIKVVWTASYGGSFTLYCGDTEKKIKIQTLF